MHANRDYVKATYGGIDILVNNAGIAFKAAATEPMGHQAEVTIKTNYFSTKNVCNTLFPLLKDGARVVNVSSSVGWLAQMQGKDPGNAELKKKFASPNLTVAEVDDLMNQFINAAKDGSYADKGWPGSTYRVSKVTLVNSSIC